MYELICPSCKHKVARSFVRIGAQAVCESCAHRFVVQKEYVQRQVTVAAFSGEDKDNPLLLDGSVTRPPPPPRQVAAPPRPVEQSVPISTVAGTPTATAPSLTPIHQIPSHQEPSPDVARLIARHRSRRKRKGRLIAGGIAIGILVTVAVVTFVMRSFDTGGDDDQSLGNLSLQIVSAQRLDRPKWVTVEGETFDGVLPESKATLEDGQMVPFNSQFMMYSAQVRATGFEVIENATLHLILLDRGSMSVIARCQVPLMLLSGHRTEHPRRPITVFVPKDLAERGRIVSWIQVKDVMLGGAMFPNVISEPVSEGNRTAIHITAFNPLDNEINRCVFLIRAFDEREAAVAQWRVVFERNIGPQQRVALAALASVEAHWSIHAWEVVGAGGLSLGDDVSEDAP